MSSPPRPDPAELAAGLEHVRRSPRDGGAIELVVRRPREGEREVVDAADLDPLEGLVGDDWKQRGSRKTTDGSAHPAMQLTLMNARTAALVAGHRERWPLAGDQLYLDLDLSQANLPAGARLALGDALIEVTAEPHLGCRKFAERFGASAVEFVNSDVGRALRLRGANARIVRGGRIRTGDVARKAGLCRAPALESDRLLLHPVTPADTGWLLTHWSQPQVRRHLWDDRLPTVAEVEAIVASSIASARDHGFCLWSASLADGDAFVGVAGIRSGARGPELIYSLEPPRWHRGYALEASRAVLAHCFETLGLGHMDAAIDAPNAESARVLERLGFRETSRETVNARPHVFYRLDAPRSK
jgi:RimJ/RimL family protein N-acetyltransferase